jgi:hypothetical protein
MCSLLHICFPLSENQGQWTHRAVAVHANLHSSLSLKHLSFVLFWTTLFNQSHLLSWKRFHLN